MDYEETARTLYDMISDLEPALSTLRRDQL